MKNKILRFLVVICVIVIVASPALFVSASQNNSNTFVMSCGRPSTGSSSGYVEILLKNLETGTLSVRVFSWNLYQVSSGYNSDKTQLYLTDVSLRVEVIKDYDEYGHEAVVFKIPNIIGLDDSIFGFIYSDLSSSSPFVEHISGSSDSYAYITGREIVGYHFYGNCLFFPEGSFESEEFYVLYAEEGAVYNAIISGQENQTNQIIQGQQQQTDAITSNQNANTDKLLDAGSDTAQPDFNSANSSVDNTTNQMQSIEGSYKIDVDATQSALSSGNNFILGTDMQKASIQVKNWIERFGNENIVISGFLVAAMVLGLCFWVIGRKSFK